MMFLRRTLTGVRFHSYVRGTSRTPMMSRLSSSGYDDENTRKLVVDPKVDFFFSKTTPH